ncbi:MAG TPA: type II toxin-antitoxin system RelE/ParE family toxin [Chlamydiales bacterium]|nr:type II toxin-antitoxin system RelE/ParE family toxin [Chlamydiales bacterium]
MAQQGFKDEDTKPLLGFGGCSVLEIVKSDGHGTYRSVYTVRFSDAVYVLHVFQKKSKTGIKTPKPDMDLIQSRLSDAQYIHEDRMKKSQS